MTKEYYKKLIDKYLEEDIFNGTDKLSSVSSLWRSDSDINYDDRQELMMYIAKICIDGLKYHGISKLDDMISNPLESSTNIDNMISQHDNMIDSIIDNLEKSPDSKKDNHKLNQNYTANIFYNGLCKRTNMNLVEYWKKRCELAEDYIEESPTKY